MGKKGVISEEEQRVLQEFWVYCQPVDLYACLAGRLRSNPVCLSRTLCYHREAARTPASVHGHAGSLRLELGGLSSTPLSVVAALCHKTEASEYQPISSTLLHLPPAPLGAMNMDTAATAAASLILPHSSTAADEAAQKLVVIMLAMEDHQDLRHLKPRQGAPMTSRLQPHLAFGLIPAEAAVLCGSVSIDSQRLELQHFVSLDKVTLRPGILHIEPQPQPQQNEHVISPPAYLTFTPAAPQHEQQAQRQLSLKVRREAVLPQLPDRPDSKVRVFYQYFYHNDERHVVEKMAGYKCAFCRMVCRSLTGLQQHLEATHDLFVYGFSRDHPDVVPTVNVHIAPDVYNSHGEFVQLDIDAYHMPANKEFVFCCTRLQRAVRVQQYHLQSQPDAPLGRPHLAATDRRLPQFRTGVREPLKRMSSVDDSTASDQQVADGMPAARRKGSRTMPPPPLRVRQPDVQYFHSRSCIPMTREEAEASVDSDDEPDTEAWQRRAREQLRDTQDLRDCEKEFVLNWNSSTERKPIYGDLFLPARVQDFVREHAQVIAGHAQLRECCVNFLILLWDYCLLSSEEVDACVELVAV